MTQPPWTAPPFSRWPPDSGFVPPVPLSVSAGAGGGAFLGVPLALAGSAAGGTPPETFLWTVVSKPAGGVVTFVDATSATTSVTFTVAAGRYVLQLVATDAVGTVAGARVTYDTAVNPFADAIGVWYIDTFQSSPRSAIANAQSAEPLSANLFGGPRNEFASVLGLWDGQNIVKADHVAVAPDGSNSASQITGTGNWTLHQQNTTIPAGTYTMAASVKRAGGSDEVFAFYIANTGIRSPVKTATSAWQRFSYTFTLGAPSTTNVIGMGSSNGATNADLLVCDFELFAGAADLGPETYGLHLYPGVTGFDASAVYAAGALDMSANALALLQDTDFDAYAAITVQALVSKVAAGSTHQAILSKLDDYTQFTSMTEQSTTPAAYINNATPVVFGQSAGLWIALGKGFHVISCVFDGSSVQYWLDDVLAFEFPATAGALSIVDFVLNLTNVAPLYGGNSYAGILSLWARALSASEVRACVPIQQARAALSGISAPRVTRFLAAEGDSITQGGYAPAVTSYAYDFGPNAAPVLYGRNNAVSGSTVADLVARAPELDAVIPPDTTGRKFILSVLIGANDLQGAGSVPTFLTDLAAYLDARMAAGWIVVLCTILPQTTVGFNAKRNTANATLVTWAGLHCDDICDFAADPVMGPDAAASDVLLYPDGEHPSNVGQSNLEAVYRPVINAL